jgi:hypothetical protein
MNKSKFALLLCLVLGIAFSVDGFAQSDNAQISGYVKDSTGAVVPGVSVVAKSQTREFERSAISNNEGYYVISNLPPGLYNVTAELSGFKRFQETNKKLDPGMATSVNVTLEVGQVTDTVSVVASVSNVQSETATVGKLVEGKQIDYMQLNGRNPLFLAILKPGVSRDGALGGSLDFGLTTGGLNINGSRTQDNLITFDGAVGVRTRSNGTSIGVPDVDTVQEVQILTADYGAEYGRSAGGQVRIITKSGTRDFHGNAYEFLRNSALDANTFERNRLNRAGDKPCSQFPKEAHCRPEPFRFNQFGYNGSGPVLLPFTSYNRDRTKLFWLWGQEWVRRRRASTAITTVPSDAMRMGDFSELLGPNRFFPGVVTIRDPLRSGRCEPTPSNPLPGVNYQEACFDRNIIPQTRLSPNGTALLSAYPRPTSGFIGPGSANFFQERPTTTDQRKDTISVDFYPSEKHQIRWRAQLYHFVDVSAFRANTDRAPQIITRPNQTTSINWVWTISPTFINELLVTGSRDQVYIAVDTRGGTFRRSLYGINYPYVFPNRKEIFDKIPTINFASPITDLDGGPYPSSSTGPIYDFSDNMTKIWGNHTFKFGALFERSGQNDFDQINVVGVPGGTNNQNGRFEFRNTTPGGTGLDLANAALGLFSSYAEIGVRSFTPYRGHMFEWFAQDSWKVTQRLRLELGLRHTIIQPYYSLWRNMVVFDPRFYNPAIAVTQDPATGFITSGDLRSQYNGLVIPGSVWTTAALGRIPIADSGQFDFLFRGVPKQYSKIHKTNFQPRIGVAYSLNDKTVIRAGAGRFITRLGVSDSVFLGGNPPLQPMVSISNGGVDNPAGGSNRAFPLNITTQDFIFNNPEAWAWNVMVEREIGFNTTVEIGYVGRRGLHGQRERNLNQLPAGTCPNGNCPLINPSDPMQGRLNADVLRSYKGFGPIRVTNNDANSLYNALEVSATRRFSAGLSFGVAYTFSKNMDDGSAQRFIIPDAYNAHNLWGPADFDRRHVLVINAIYELPFFRTYSNLTGKLLGGWTISAVSQFQTGQPFSVATSDDFAGVGTGSGLQYWVVNGNPQLNRGDRRFSESNSDSNFWFRTRDANGNPIFTRPVPGTFSNQRVRNLIYAPGLQTHNLGLFKDFRITEVQKIQFRFEAFNWVNHPNWSNPSTDINSSRYFNPTSSSFGKVTGKNLERQLQFSLRYSF